jgi:hypothetical protein
MGFPHDQPLQPPSGIVPSPCSHLHALSDGTLLTQILDANPNICMVVDQERRIVFVNHALLKFSGRRKRTSLRGLKPGEALKCVHAGTRGEGCGTEEICSTCGTLEAFFETTQGRDSVQECRLVRNDGHVFDLRVWTSSISIDDVPCVFMTLQDVSDEKRRRVLERVFFHDILNTAGAIRGFCELFSKRTPDESDKLRERIERLSRRLINEIDAQRELADAENQELSLKPTVTMSREVLTQAIDLYDGVEMRISIDPESEDFSFKTDPTLLRRVVGNLLKNAAEATNGKWAPWVGSYKENNRATFKVGNSGFIPRQVQLRVFQRSFSTKGNGRGLGTYGAKLLAERYLKGRVTFESSEKSGTIFTASFPLDLE